MLEAEQGADHFWRCAAAHLSSSPLKTVNRAAFVCLPAGPDIVAVPPGNCGQGWGLDLTGFLALVHLALHTFQESRRSYVFDMPTKSEPWDVLLHSHIDLRQLQASDSGGYGA